MKPLIGCTLLSIDLSVMEYMRDWCHNSMEFASPSLILLVILHKTYPQIRYRKPKL